MSMQNWKNCSTSSCQKKALHEYGVKEEELPEFAKSVIENQQRLMKHSFVPLDYDKVYGIYKKLY